MQRSLAFARHLARIVVLLPFAAGLVGACDDSGSGSDAAVDSSVRDGKTGDAAKGGDAALGDAAVGDAALSDADTSDAAPGDASLDDAALDDANPGDLASLPKGPAPVLLGTSGDYVILAKTKISTVPASAVTGDVGLSPAAASFITGFSMTRAGTYWTSPQVTGKLYASDNDPPTPINLTTAISDMQTAYTDAAGRPLPDFLDLGAGAIGGLVLVPGLYKWTSTVTIPSDVTLSGGANDVWIFQMTGDLTMSAAKNVILLGGAKAKNIFWQVAGVATLGTTAHFEGIVLSQTAIILRTGASVNGRLLAQSAVTLDQSTVTAPAP